MRLFGRRTSRGAVESRGIAERRAFAAERRSAGGAASSTAGGGPWEPSWGVVRDKTERGRGSGGGDLTPCTGVFDRAGIGGQVSGGVAE